MKKMLNISIVLLHIAIAPVFAFDASVDKNYVSIDCEHVPIIRNSKPAPRKLGKSHQEYSTNWAGYASLTNLSSPANGSVSMVSGQWTIPELLATPSNASSAIWVGIDGYSSNSVEQLGTEQDWQNGRQTNYAWYEMYPGYSYSIAGFPTNVGDIISAEVLYLGNNIFKLSMMNHTVGVIHSFSIDKTLPHDAVAKRSSAEWIVEAPFDGKVLPLAHFSPDVVFTNCSTTINGITGAINNSNWQNTSIGMETSSGATKASVSGLKAGGTAFTTTWYHE